MTTTDVRVVLTITANDGIRTLGLADRETAREALAYVTSVGIEMLGWDDARLDAYLDAVGTWPGDARA